MGWCGINQMGVMKKDGVMQHISYGNLNGWLGSIWFDLGENSPKLPIEQNDVVIFYGKLN